MEIEDKLIHTKINVDIKPHITVDTKACWNCAEKSCLYVCPVQNFKMKDNEIVFNWEGCLECGACRIVCRRGVTLWTNPRGGFGIRLRFG